MYANNTVGLGFLPEQGGMEHRKNDMKRFRSTYKHRAGHRLQRHDVQQQ